MIERIHLEDFQAHRDREIVFGPGITVIVGDTDVGKSSIMRAIAWVASNKPSGEDFISWWAKQSVVTLEVNGSVIVRCRGKGENSYNLNSDELKAFGNDVPEEIRDLLRLAPINFQFQHDAPFWFGESAGEVSRQLNDIVDLGVIDEVLGEMASKLRKAQDMVNVCGERARELKQRYEDTRYASQMDEELRVIEKTAAALDKCKARADRLHSLLKLLRDKRTNLSTNERMLADGARLLEAGKILRQLIDRADGLHFETVRARALQETVDQKLPSLADAEDALKRVQALRSKRSALETLVRRARTQETVQTVAARNYENLHKEFHKALGDGCPLCGHKKS